jgi:hypothetical protein
MAVPAPSKASVPSPAPKPPKPGIDIFTQLHGQKLGYRSWYILIWWVKIHFFYRFGGSYIYNIYIYHLCAYRNDVHLQSFADRDDSVCGGSEMLDGELW